MVDVLVAGVWGYWCLMLWGGLVCVDVLVCLLFCVFGVLGDSCFG